MPVAAIAARTPWCARAAALVVAAYALSPIDLVPDFIPIVGYLDDLIIVPLGIWLAIRMIPPALLAEFRARADGQTRPRSWWGALFVVLIWLAGMALVGTMIW